MPDRVRGFASRAPRLLVAVVMTLTLHAAAAAQPDIHAYVLNIGAGNRIYTAFGHTAIRMACPEKGLDYCFTFEMDMSQSNVADVLMRKAKAGFAVQPTGKFIAAYRGEGRGVTEFELNLTLPEKQEMWRALDAEIQRGATWTFDFIDVNCTSMVLYVIEKALGTSRLEFGSQPPVMRQGTLADVLDSISDRSPWIRMALRAVLAGELDRKASPEKMASPELTAMMLPSATVIDDGGRRRRLTKGAREVTAQTVAPAPCAFAPWMAAVLALAATVMAAGAVARRKQFKFNH